MWLGDSKIAAVGILKLLMKGIGVKRHITLHGFALNCTVDLGWFRHITPCGLEGKNTTSLSKLCKTDISIEKTVPVLLHQFSKQFKRDAVPLESINPQIVKEIEEMAK